MPTTADLAGIDGCPGGWVAAQARGSRIEWAVAPIPEVASLVAPVTAVDMPLGLVDRGWRECDQLARAAMGTARSRVFLVPPRPVLELADAPNEAAQAACRELTGQGVSRQALALAPRILALEAACAAEPRSRVAECFPELAFMRMAATHEPLASKKTARGVGQRMAALHRWRPGIAEVLALAPEGIPVDDCLDALACLWSAERLASGTAVTLGTGPSIAF